MTEAEELDDMFDDMFWKIRSTCDDCEHPKCRRIIESAKTEITNLITAYTERAIKIHDLEQRVEELDIQCDEGICRNCDSKRPILKKLQLEIKDLKGGKVE